MNRLGVYDVDAAFDKMSLQTADEFGLDAILERLVRAADVEGVRRLIEVSTPEGYRVPAACLRAAQQTAYVFDDAGKESEVLRAWRAEQARELLFLKRLVKRARDRKRARAELTMTHRLFLLRDDHLFVRILGYCWFVDTERRLRYAGPADS